MPQSADKNSQLATAFDEVAAALTYQGENHYKIAAYVRFATLLRTLDSPIDQIAARGELDSLPGVGDAIRTKVLDWVSSGTFALLDRVRAEVPRSIQEMMAQGLPPTLLRRLTRDLGVRSAADLRAAIEDGRIARTPLTPAQRALVEEWYSE